MSFTSCGSVGSSQPCRERASATRTFFMRHFHSSGQSKPGRTVGLVTDMLKLQRLNAGRYVPFPRAVRVGGYIYTSSIYPIDDDGRVVAGRPWLGVAPPSPIAVQPRHCLPLLHHTLAELGSSLPPVVKSDAHLAFAS